MSEKKLPRAKYASHMVCPNCEDDRDFSQFHETEASNYFHCHMCGIDFFEEKGKL